MGKQHKVMGIEVVSWTPAALLVKSEGREVWVRVTLISEVAENGPCE